MIVDFAATIVGRVRRTTHGSSSGTKFYAVSDQRGRFVDIQACKGAQGLDIKRKSRCEKKGTL